MNTQTFDTIIAGGGISGLSTAAFLKNAGKSVLLLEKEACAGGTMTTSRENGFLVDHGPNTVVLNNPHILEMVRFAGMESQLCYAATDAKKRFIVRNGKMHALPSGPFSFIRSPLFSPAAKLRLLLEPFIGRGPADESVGSFVSRRLGREFLDYAVDPFISGVYAGDPSKLSARWAVSKIFSLEEKYGGLMRGAVLGAKERARRKREMGETAKTRSHICNFINGISSFPEGLVRAQKNSVLISSTIQKIRKEPDGFILECLCGKKSETFRCRTLVSALPAYAAQPLLDQLSLPSGPSLAEIPYAPLAQVFVGYKRPQVSHPLDGFGVLIPEKERFHLLGALLNSSLFPGRAPANHVALTCFIGGMKHPEYPELGDEALLSITLSDLKKILPIQGDPVFFKIKRWKQAIPQYHQDYEKFLIRMNQIEQKVPGLFIRGNARGGISVGDCISNAAETARTICASLPTVN